MSILDRTIFSRGPLVCREVVELVTDYVEDTLSRRDRRRFEQHLAGCPHCTEYLVQMRRTLDLTGRLVPGDFSPDALQNFEEIYRKWREGE